MSSNEENARRAVAYVRVLGTVLSRLVAANDAQTRGIPPAEVTRFHALRAPSISVGDYLDRIRKYSQCSAECFILALVYIDRLIQRKGITLTSLNVHRVVITSVMLAAKFFDDHYYNNAFYGRIGGVPTAEMNGLELELLFSINFSLHVPGAVFNRYFTELQNHVPAMPPSADMPHLHAMMAQAPRALEYAPAVEQQAAGGGGGGGEGGGMGGAAPMGADGDGDGDGDDYGDDDGDGMAGTEGAGGGKVVPPAAARTGADAGGLGRAGGAAPMDGGRVGARAGALVHGDGRSHGGASRSSHGMPSSSSASSSSRGPQAAPRAGGGGGGGWQAPSRGGGGGGGGGPGGAAPMDSDYGYGDGYEEGSGY